MTAPRAALPLPMDVPWPSLHDIPKALTTSSNVKTTTVRALAAMAGAAGLLHRARPDDVLVLPLHSASVRREIAQQIRSGALTDQTSVMYSIEPYPADLHDQIRRHTTVHMAALSLRSSVPWQEQVTLAYIDEPPFAKPESDGRASGCDIDLAQTVLRAIGVLEVDLCLTTFAELLPGVAAGRWTINVPLFVTQQRAASVAFSRPVWALEDGFVVAAANPKRIDSYRTIAAQGFRLGVVAAQVQRDSAVRAGVSTDHIWEFATQQAAIEALLAGTIDAYASTALGNRTLVRELTNPRLLAVESDHVQASRSGGPPVGAYSFAHHNIGLRQKFDEYLAIYLGSKAHRDRAAAFGLSAREIDPIAPGKRVLQ